MGLDIYLAGRKIIDYQKPRREDGYDVHAIELNIANWGGWCYGPLSDYVQEVGENHGDEGKIWLNEHNLNQIIDFLTGSEPLPENPNYDTDTLTVEERIQVAIRFQTALTWLTDRNQPIGEERKVYFEISC